jgi:Ca2+-binding RTX toxin-like protein
MRNRTSRRRLRLSLCLVISIVLPAAFTSVASADTNTFSNPNPIAIPGTGTQGVANPYPSTIRLSGFTPAGTISDVNVRLENLAHTYPDDIDAVLVGPNGQNVLLMSDTGGSNDVNVDLTFDDQAGTNLPDGGPLLSGTYKPTDFPPADTFPTPGPSAPFGNNLSAFNGTSPNGDWRLFVFDDAAADVGSMAGGWSLSVTTPTNQNPTGQAVTGAGVHHFLHGACSNPQRGTNGNDVLNGTRFGDRLSGRRGNDRLRGRRGRDCLFGGSGRDRLDGGPGRDRLSGGPGRDVLKGRSGNDRLKGGSGRDRFFGGSGNDRINSRGGGVDRVNCGSGFDRVRADVFDIVNGNCEVVL